MVSTQRPNVCFHEDDIDNDILIDEIELRQLIYDNSSKDYSNSNMKAKAWEEVGIKVFFNIWETFLQKKKQMQVSQLFIYHFFVQTTSFGLQVK